MIPPNPEWHSQKCNFWPSLTYDADTVRRPVRWLCIRDTCENFWTGLYRNVCTGGPVFRSSGIEGPTTAAASSSAREPGLENLNFNCLPRPDQNGLRNHRKRNVVREIACGLRRYEFLERYRENVRFCKNELV